MTPTTNTGTTPSSSSTARRRKQCQSSNSSSRMMRRRRTRRPLPYQWSCLLWLVVLFLGVFAMAHTTRTTPVDDDDSNIDDNDDRTTITTTTTTTTDHPKEIMDKSRTTRNSAASTTSSSTRTSHMDDAASATATSATTSRRESQEQEEETTTTPFPTTIKIHSIQSVPELQHLTSPAVSPNVRVWTLLLLAANEDGGNGNTQKCRPSQELQETFQGALEVVFEEQDEEDLLGSVYRHQLAFASIAYDPTSADSAELFQTLNVESTPTIIFLKLQPPTEESSGLSEEEEENKEVTYYHMWTTVYQGTLLLSSPTQVAQGLAHYWSRLLFSEVQYRHQKRYKEVNADDKTNKQGDNKEENYTFHSYLAALTLSFSSWDDMTDVVLSPSFFVGSKSASPDSVPPLDPLLAPQEQAWIRNVWQRALLGEDASTTTQTTSINEQCWVVVQCEIFQEDEENDDDSKDKDEHSSSSFDELAAVLSLHHQVAFAVIRRNGVGETDCSMMALPHPNGDNSTTTTNSVSIYRVVVDDHNSTETTSTTGTRRLQWFQTLQNDDDSSSPSKTYNVLSQTMARLLRPTVLWWDRQTTTPIAFSPYYRVHAVLVVDFHTEEEDTASSSTLDQVLTEFGRLCQTYHYVTTKSFQLQEAANNNNNNKEEDTSSSTHDDMVCLIVPSTETRVLTTFGIDIWSGLDERISRQVQQQQQQDQQRKQQQEQQQQDQQRKQQQEQQQKEQDESPSSQRDNDGGKATKPTADKKDDDFISSSSSSSTPSTTLPLLLITNRTETQGVQRYYLDPPLLTTPGRMTEFVQDFWAHRLQPELHSRASSTGGGAGGTPTTIATTTMTSRPPPSPPTNAHGVAEWTAYHHVFHRSQEGQQGNRPASSRSDGEDEQQLYRPPPHTLLMIYAPTCGHCKRLSVVWNALGRLIRHVDWQNWLQIARLDVTHEEFTAVGASLLPSVYYYYNNDDVKEDPDNSNANASSYPIWFDRREVGALNDPLELLEWFLDVGVGLDQAALLEALLVAEVDDAALNEDLNGADNNIDDQTESDGRPSSAK